MWIYKIILLLALIATWIPRESKSATLNSITSWDHAHAVFLADEPEEQEDDEGSEELAA